MKGKNDVKLDLIYNSVMEKGQMGCFFEKMTDLMILPVRTRFELTFHYYVYSSNLGKSSLISFVDLFP